MCTRLAEFSLSLLPIYSVFVFFYKMSQPHEDCSEWHAEGNIVTASSGRAIHSLVHEGRRQH